MLKIKNLYAGVKDGQGVLNGIDLDIGKGQVHAIMGPNGSGKSTLSHVLADHPEYEVTKGELIWEGDKNLLDYPADKRSVEGVFLSFQYPVSLPGVSVLSFLQAIINNKRKALGQSLLDAYEVIQKTEQAIKIVGLDSSFLQRSLNDGFSGGEKKRCELLQMILLQPKLCILDEVDSGLDIDALKMLSAGVDTIRDDSRSFIVVTHYQRLLNYIKPDFVHVMIKGKIVASGGAELALELEKKGYSWLERLDNNEG